jgi:hypothetical protein
MRRRQALKRGRVLSIVIAGFAGYVIGGWNGSVPRSPALSAAQSVALRFPQELGDASPVTVAFATPANAAAMGNTRLVLFSPQPMVASAPQAPAQQASAAQLPTPQVPLQMASAEQTLPQPAPAAKRPNNIKPAAAAVHNREDRAAGLMLNDAQIASIKTRLHLTPDQEQMWPAVEAALRNIAYTRSREARRHGAPANTQVASADADGVDVRDLKSAAIPLIMSFNSEQKDEVRNLAHVMGLDQLATQF